MFTFLLAFSCLTILSSCSAIKLFNSSNTVNQEVAEAKLPSEDQEKIEKEAKAEAEAKAKAEAVAKAKAEAKA